MKEAVVSFKEENTAYTGFETAILLAIFVMVAAVFANIVLHTEITASLVSNIEKETDNKCEKQPASFQESIYNALFFHQNVKSGKNVMDESIKQTGIVRVSE
jgi:archaellin